MADETGEKAHCRTRDDSRRDWGKAYCKTKTREDGGRNSGKAYCRTKKDGGQKLDNGVLQDEKRLWTKHGKGLLQDEREDDGRNWKKAYCRTWEDGGRN